MQRRSSLRGRARRAAAQAEIVPSDVPAPPPSKLCRCDNCGAYGIMHESGDCEVCGWQQQPSRLPSISPLRREVSASQVSPEAQRDLERRLILLNRTFERSAYVKLSPRKSPRPSGAASRVSVTEPLPWLPRRSTPPTSVRVAPPDPDAPPRPNSAWSLEKSIWAPRKRQADSRAFYDTEKCVRRALETDLERALADGLEKFILRHDDGESDDGQGGDGGEVAEVRSELHRHANLFYSVFDYYAALGSSADINSITFNSFKQLCTDGGLAIQGSAHSDDAHLDQLFIAVNSASAASTAAPASGSAKPKSSRSLDRSELLQVFVRIAIARFILDGRQTDVSAALGLFFHLLRNRLAAVPEAMHDANAIRRNYCYTEPIDAVLTSRRRSLRAIFDAYAGCLRVGLADAKNRRMGYDEWQLLLKHLLVYDKSFQQREGTLTYAWCRMRVVDEASARGRARLNGLSFEDWLEALVRVSTMKALPTDAELDAAGAADAGAYLIALRGRPASYDAFVEARDAKWNSTPSQPIDRCLTHLLALFFRTIEAGEPRSRAATRARAHRELRAAQPPSPPPDTPRPTAPAPPDTAGEDDLRLTKREVTLFYQKGGASFQVAELGRRSSSSNVASPDGRRNSLGASPQFPAELRRRNSTSLSLGASPQFPAELRRRSSTSSISSLGRNPALDPSQTPISASGSSQ